MAEAEASFKIEILSIDSGSTLFIFTSTPSTKIKGEAFAFIDPSPLIFQLEVEPGSPPRIPIVIFKFGDAPLIRSPMFTADLFWISLPDIASTDPVTVTFFWVP